MPLILGSPGDLITTLTGVIVPERITSAGMSLAVFGFGCRLPAGLHARN